MAIGEFTFAEFRANGRPMAIDQVRLEGLELPAPIGVYAHEHGILQRLVVDVVAFCDLSRAGETDALEDGLDYDGLAAICRTVAASRHHQLIETVALGIVNRIREQYAPRVRGVEVRVAKPGAVPDARTVAVVMRRDFDERSVV